MFPIYLSHCTLQIRIINRWHHRHQHRLQTIRLRECVAMRLHKSTTLSLFTFQFKCDSCHFQKYPDGCISGACQRQKGWHAQRTDGKLVVRSGTLNSKQLNDGNKERRKPKGVSILEEKVENYRVSVVNLVGLKMVCFIKTNMTEIILYKLENILDNPAHRAINTTYPLQSEASQKIKCFSTCKMKSNAKDISVKDSSIAGHFIKRVIWTLFSELNTFPLIFKRFLNSLWRMIELFKWKRKTPQKSGSDVMLCNIHSWSTSSPLSHFSNVYVSGFHFITVFLHCCSKGVPRWLWRLKEETCIMKLSLPPVKPVIPFQS